MHKNAELAEAIRRTAYFFWEQDGRPEGKAQDYWLKAKAAHLRQLAFDRWLAEGSQPGREEDNWHAVEKEIDPEA
ncbi:MAG: DUF2934 domain-containing protein [Hyphomicrobiales bacterium]|nr:MAG: DUF2934 domain-containing protein [Hyphomicrobiales bacterium]